MYALDAVCTSTHVWMLNMSMRNVHVFVYASNCTIAYNLKKRKCVYVCVHHNCDLLKCVEKLYACTGMTHTHTHTLIKCIYSTKCIKRTVSLVASPCSKWDFRFSFTFILLFVYIISVYTLAKRETAKLSISKQQQKERKRKMLKYV